MTPLRQPFAFESGVYLIRNQVNLKTYVGRSKSLRRRANKHICDLQRGKHCNTPLQRAWVKYGPSAFSFEVLIFCAPALLLTYEKQAFEALKPAYNICKEPGNSLGVRLKPATKTKLAEYWKGRVFSPSHRAAISESKKNPSPSQRQAISTRLTGRPVSKETRKKIGASRLKLSPEQVLEIRKLAACGIAQAKIGRSFGVSQSTIGAVVRGKTYTDISNT